MNEIRIERVRCGDVELAVTVTGSGPLVVLLHGFPELAFSWRHQIRDLAAAGFRVIAPDMRGYGASDSPGDVEAYDIFRLTGDVAHLIDHFGGGPALVAGHDWGAIVAWSFAQFRPDLVAGVVGMSVPFMPSLDASLIDVSRARVGPDDFHDILYFQEPEVAERELEADVLFTLRHVLWRASGDPRIAPAERLEASTPTAGDPAFAPRFLAGDIPPGLPAWIGEGEFHAYGQAFLRTGFRGPINWYRNLQGNWERSGPWRGAGIGVPALFVAGRRDPVLTAGLPPDVERMEDHPMLAQQRAFCPNLVEVLIDDGGHWIQQEHPDAVSEALIGFLDMIGHHPAPDRPGRP